MKLTTTEVLRPRDTLKEASAFASFLEATGPLKKKKEEKLTRLVSFLSYPSFMLTYDISSLKVFRYMTNRFQCDKIFRRKLSLLFFFF